MKTTTLQSYQEKVLRVHLRIREALSRGEGVPSLEVLAEEACLSPFHFHRVFRGLTGESLAEHIRRLRLEWAAGQLRFSEKGVLTIALEAGYESHEAFTRAFSRCFGKSPSCYRGEQAHPGLEGIYMKIAIKTVPARKVLFVRHTGPYADCGKAWGALCGWAGPRGLMGPRSQFLGLSYDDPDITPPEKLRYDACLIPERDVEAVFPVSAQEIPGGEYAVTLHEGPLEKLHETYQRMCGEWLPTSGRSLKPFPSVEIYLNDPDRTPPEKLKVEIQIPLES
jgi:AraC family transcriptional regulator